MSNRVTEGLMYGQTQDAVGRARGNMLKNQEQAVSGKKANRISDDPVGAARIVSLRANSARGEQVAQNLEFGQSFLNMTDAALGELTELVSRAKELSIQMSSSTNSSADAQASTANEIDQLFLRAVQIGNTRLGDRYIFGGYQTTRPPFDSDGNFYGDDGQIELELDQGQRIGVNVTGLSPFYGVEGMGAKRGEMRQDPKQDAQPSVEGQMRAPASIEAEERGLDPKLDPQAYGEIQKRVGVNVFAVLRGLSDGLKTNNMAQIQESLDGLDGAFKQIISSRALVGARSNALRAGTNSLENSKVLNAELLSNVEDADSLKVFSDMARTENSLKTALETNKKIISNSLIDFLK
jgi:flagellar hook-associated protein 3 FlgL